MKKCFVITPIGEGSSDIRRHIDGIIDQAIIPALEGKYEVEVAHRKFEIGSINDRVIKDIYNADLVVANLTSLNPNVMFELAMRYSFAKPAIVIAEDGTKLPFDIIDENTIFYINDPAGANDLKNQIKKFEENIDCTKKYGPVFKAISTIPLYEEVETSKDVSSEKMLSYIIDRLNNLESYIGAKNEKVARQVYTMVKIEFDECENRDLREAIVDMILDKYSGKIVMVTTTDSYIKIGLDGILGKTEINSYVARISDDMNKMGVKQLKYSYSIE